VRQPRHPIVRVLTQTTVGALTSGGTRQFGAAPDMHCSLSGAPLTSALTSAANCSCQGHCAVDRYAGEPLLRWCTGQSGGTPDSPVNYSRATLEKPEGGESEMVRPWCTGHYSMAHWTVRCARPGYSSVSIAPFI
jgi:hypothetical protein